MTLHELSVCILRARSGNLSFFFVAHILSTIPHLCIPICTHEHGCRSTLSLLIDSCHSQSGRGTVLQYHKGQWLFAYCIRDRAMNSRTHKSMRIDKSRWYTRAKAGAAPYPKGLRKYRGVRICKYIYPCTSAPLPPWRSQQSPAQLVDLLADLGSRRVLNL